MTEINLEEIIDKPLGGKKSLVLDSQVFTAVMNCPRLSDFRFNHNLQSIHGKSNSLECGSIVHTFLETYYGNIIKGIKKTDAEGYAWAAAQMYIQGCRYCTDFTPSYCNQHKDLPVGEKFDYKSCEECKSRPECGHQVDQFPGVRNTPPEPDKDNPREKYKTGWKWVLESCQQYLDHYRNDSWTPLFVELVKGKVLYEDDEIRILWKAKLDIGWDTNQGVYPGDHKTMKQNRDSLSLNNQFIGQCLVMETQRVIINKFGFQKSLKPEEKFIRVPQVYSQARLLEWQSETLPYYAKLLLMYAETGHFPPQYGHCETKYGKCAFSDVCEGEPDDRERLIKLNFMVGPEWNPINNEENED